MNYCFLNQALVFRISGRHAERYLNARLSNNVKNLSLNQGQFAACITAQGRTQVFGAVIKLNDAYLYIVDGGDANEVKQHIRQFIVADQVDVEDVSSKYQLLHLNAADDFDQIKNLMSIPNLNSELNVIQNAEVITCSRKRSIKMGLDLLCLTDVVSNDIISKLKNLPAAEITTSELAYQQMQAKIVTYPNELADIFFPEAQLDSAISENKGGYCGQEAVEMVRSRGKLPATLLVYQAKGKQVLEKDCNLYSKSDQVTTLAKVLSSTYSEKDDTTLIFVRLRQNASAENSEVLVENAASGVLWQAI